MHRTAVTHLKRADPVLARVIERVGPCRYAPRKEGPHFDALVRSIIYQQLSGKAAATIHARFIALYPRHPKPEQVLATPDETLRGAGLSRQKIAYLRSLAEHVHSGELPLARIARLSDESILERLVAVKGIGRWTAQMFMMFRLGRLDVLPDLDLGIQNAIREAYGLKKRPTPKEVLRIGEGWRPYATIASWYLWRSLDS